MCFCKQPHGRDLCRGAVYKTIGMLRVRTLLVAIHFPFREIRAIRVDAVSHSLRIRGSTASCLAIARSLRWIRSNARCMSRSHRSRGRSESADALNCVDADLADLAEREAAWAGVECYGEIAMCFVNSPKAEISAVGLFARTSGCCERLRGPSPSTSRSARFARSASMQFPTRGVFVSSSMRLPSARAPTGPDHFSTTDTNTEHPRHTRRY